MAGLHIDDEGLTARGGELDRLEHLLRVRASSTLTVNRNAVLLAQLLQVVDDPCQSRMRIDDGDGKVRWRHDHVVRVAMQATVVLAVKTILNLSYHWKDCGKND